MMTATVRKTTLENKQLRDGDYSGIIPSCLHFFNVGEQPCYWIGLSSVKLNTQN